MKEEMRGINHFRFFYKDEKVTFNLSYFSHKNHAILSPSQVIGTNYGRIFVVPMFQ